jgi:hypothetical protein
LIFFNTLLYSFDILFESLFITLSIFSSFKYFSILKSILLISKLSIEICLSSGVNSILSVFINLSIKRVLISSSFSILIKFNSRAFSKVIFGMNLKTNSFFCLNVKIDGSKNKTSISKVFNSYQLSIFEITHFKSFFCFSNNLLYFSNVSVVLTKSDKKFTKYFLFILFELVQIKLFKNSHLFLSDFNNSFNSLSLF